MTHFLLQPGKWVTEQRISEGHQSLGCSKETAESQREGSKEDEEEGRREGREEGRKSKVKDKAGKEDGVNDSWHQSQVDLCVVAACLKI